MTIRGRRTGPVLKGICPECGELRHLRTGGVLGQHKRIYRKHYRSTYPCAGVDQPAAIYGPQTRSQNQNPPSSQTGQAVPEPTTALPTDPTRHQRAVIRISEQLIHQLLNLPPDIEVRHCAPGHAGLTIDVVVTSPDLPVCDEAAILPEINPTYMLVDGRAVLVDTGISSIPGARRWEWAYRYVDHNAPIWHPDQTEADVRRKAARDLSIIVLRRQPGATEWEEVPA